MTKIYLRFCLLTALAATGAVVALPPHMAFAEDSSSESGKSGNKPNNGFVEMKPFVLPVLNDDGPQQVITLVVSLQLMPGQDADKVYALQPKLNDAFLQSLYGALDRGTVRNGRLIDVVKVKQKLKIACEQVLGPGVVQDVLVQDIAQRQFN